ncbi:outer membrane beta-barrel family protein [Pedobacter aquatilis]|uniref:outer membrane beta-barrel family protein n=1 Tax=Pedobacter aquatilis TaxID=351343 RepID=UPI0029318FB6|nr:outer membrane beta-barrel family protein [Pedobacter aquatilis]
MNKKLTAFFVVWISIALNFVQAQQNSSKISGRVVNGENNNLELATIALYNSKDSVLLKTTLSEASGQFSFNNLAFGKYHLRVSSIGFGLYKSGEIELSEKDNQINIGDVKLLANQNMLKEVTVSGKKAFVEQKIDRMVVNVDALISNAGTNALEVLSKSPGVNVDQNGVISLKGKSGINIFIDDKPTYLSGPDLENYLRSLPSSTLEQIEIMTNPPAKYDAAGNAGVINIKTKKNKVAGFNGGINLSLTQGQLTRSNNSANFNFRRNKLNVFGNISHNLNNSFTDLDLNRTYKNADDSPKYYFNQNSYFRRHGNTFNAKAGVDFYQTEKTTWGFVFTGMSRISEQVNNNTSNLLNANKQPDSVIKAKNIDNINYKNAAFNLNYRHKFDKEGGDFSFDLDYLNYRNQTEQAYTNDSYFANMQLKSQDLLTGDLPSNIQIYTAKTDYSKNLNKHWKFEAGLKSSYTKTDNAANYLYTANQVTVVDYEKTNQFVYKENINAAYANVSMEGKRFSLQGGLRFESTISDGHQLGNLLKPDSSFRRTYNNLFPTLYFSYKLDTASKNQIGLNYGKRVDRPYYQDLNPFFSPLDKFTYYVGNPFLRPSFTQSLELSHTYKNKITTTLGYSWVKDDVNETIEIVEGTYYSRPANIGKGTVKNISVNADFDITKWLSTHIYAELANIVSKTDFYTGFLKTNGTYFRTNPNLQFKISPTWSAEANLRYQSKFSSVQFLIGPIHEFGAAVQKKLSTRSTLKLSASDIFRDRVVVGVINNLAATNAGWINRQDSRSLILSYSYRFGKAFSAPAKHESSGADAEKNRVKN